MDTDKQKIAYDQALWERVKKGDNVAISRLYHRYFQLLYSYAFRICNNKEASKDCVHDLFVHLWEEREKLSEVSNVKSYLLTAVRNRTLKIRKQNAKFITKEEEHSISVEKIFSIEHIMIHREEEEENRQQMMTALEELTTRQKELIYLQFYEGLSIREIQERTSLQYQSVKNLTYRALTKLRQALKKDKNFKKN